MKFVRIVFAVLFYMSVAGIAWAERPVRFSYFEFPPFMSQSLPGRGLQPTIVRTVLALLDKDAAFQALPPARAMLSAEKGTFDGTVGWVWSEQRARKFYYSLPIFASPLVFFHLKCIRFNWQSYDDLSGFPMGIVYKNYYGPEFHNALDTGKITVQEVAHEAMNFDKMLVGRITLFPVNLQVGYHLIKQKYDAEKAALFTHCPQPLKISEYHVLFSKAVPENITRVKRFNEALLRFKKSGEYERLCRNFPTESACLPQLK